MSCGNCRPNSLPAPQTAPLLRIRQGYRARWNDLALLVESDSQGWALHVQDSALHNLYTAYRVGPEAAQVAAAEYAISRTSGFANSINANRLARELNWQAYW
jgi:hypothetical protein